MKIILMIALGLFLLFAGSQAWTYFSTENTEQQAYNVIEHEGNIEIRLYPSATLASVSKKGKMGDISSDGFRTLAGYIFGGNEDQKSIPMTAPVRMVENSDSTVMSFVMPSKEAKEGLPQPNSTRITMEQTETVYAATLRFGGFMRSADLKSKKAELLSWLDKKGINYHLPIEYLSYNPPYQTVGRRNEIYVRIDY